MPKGERIKWAVFVVVVWGYFLYMTAMVLPLLWVVIAHAGTVLALWLTPRLATIEPGQSYRGLLALFVFCALIGGCLVYPLVRFAL
jgi:FtsH-binding integral membrane protein